MKQIILGTAGHIDHGKTSLIKAVTGIDTDRLKEEKERGITIELGFASLDLPSGQHLGIVDVPGHEKFVKNMVAGATGIDIVVMVIAADEGVMPQTREHMEICALLGIQYGMVVLTKIDLVDEEWLELALDDVREFIQGTFLEDSPIVPVSSVNGQGIPEFINTLDELSQKVPERQPQSIFRLPIDRVFTMKGFGTVITGTLISGRVQVGESIEIYPAGITSKVRGIQVHNQSVQEAEAGMRTAINFQGLEKTAIQRGEVLSSPGALKSSYMVDVSLHFLNSNAKSIKNRSLVRFHTGTSEILGNLILLDREELSPGDTTVAQLRLNSPVALIREDRFVIRSYSPVRTIGGGEVLNPIPQKHKRFKDNIVEELKNLSHQAPEEIISYYVNASGYQGISFSDLKIMTNLPEKQLESVLQNHLSKKTIIQADKENRIYIHNNSLEKLKKNILNYLAKYHSAYPLKAGMPKEELKTKLPPALPAKLYNLSLNLMIKGNQIVQEENTVRLATHTISLGADQADVRDKILDTYLRSGLQPPYFKELSKTLDINPNRAKDVLMHLVDEALIVKIKEDLYFHAKAIDELKKRLVEFLETKGEITTPQFKKMTGVSRKYVIPLAEYFDAKNVTLRVGDFRKLRKK
ncbi:MAG: selenocysteine-specific translation elongation factor [Desulfobacterales bacterium]|nr:MAG: selenocysteine-specific translation elongation factor [Desulfobacterales bacterium]